MKSTLREGAGALLFRIPLMAAAVCLLAIQLVACSEKQPAAAAKKKGEGGAVPALTALGVAKPVPVRIQAIGNVEPYATVSIKSRVDGQIVKVPFADGQEVREG